MFPFKVFCVSVLLGFTFLTIVAAGSENERAPTGTCNREGEYFADDASCARFYICDSGLRPISYTCPQGYLFDPSINVCTANYVCPLVPECTLAGEVLPNYQDCSQYYICTAALEPPVLIQCGVGQFFSISTGVCQTNTEVDCGSRPGCFYAGYSEPNVSDCSSYYLCDASLVPVPKTCDPLFLYDVTTHQCVVASQATCAQPGPAK